jgi:hypothetical protein
VAESVTDPASDTCSHGKYLVDGVQLGAYAPSPLRYRAVDTSSRQEGPKNEAADGVHQQTHASLRLPSDRTEDGGRGSSSGDRSVAERNQPFGRFHPGVEPGLAEAESEMIFVSGAENP